MSVLINVLQDRLERRAEVKPRSMAALHQRKSG